MSTKTTITICSTMLVALALAPSALALTRHDAVWSAAQVVPAALGVPNVETMDYAQLRLRGHHATFWATCQNGTKIGEAKVSVVELANGDLHIHLTHMHTWRMPQPDSWPGKSS